MTDGWTPEQWIDGCHAAEALNVQYREEIARLTRERDAALAEVAGLKRAREADWGMNYTIRYWTRQCQKAEQQRDAWHRRHSHLRGGLTACYQWLTTDHTTWFAEHDLKQRIEAILLADANESDGNA